MSKNVVLKSLVIDNFKGLRSFQAVFGKHNEVRGFNESGKTTTYDAFFWLLFGKNVEGVKDFPIKNTKDLSLNRLDHTVKAILDVDGEEITFARTYKEVWQKKRGEEKETFTGHTSLYFYNDVPLDLGAYNEKVSSIIGEEVFKLLTHIYYFPSLPWQAMRGALVNMASIRTDEEIAQGNEDFQRLIRALTGKNQEEYKKELAARLKRTKEEYEKIPIQINEALAAKVPVNELDDETRLQVIKSQIAELQSKKDSITESNKAVFDKINKENEELSGLKTKLSEAKSRRESGAGAARAKLESEYKTQRAVIEGQISAVEAEIKNTLDAISRAKEAISSKKENIAKRQEAKQELLDKWYALNAEKEPFIDENECACPTCKRRFPEADIKAKAEELLATWNTNKASSLKDIDARGNALKNEIILLEAELSKQNDLLAELEAKVNDQKSVLTQRQGELSAIRPAEVPDSELTTAPSEEEIRLQGLIDNFKITPTPKVDFTEIDKEIAELQRQNDDVVSSKANIEFNKKQDLRVEELKAKEKILAKEIASIEKTQFVMADFNKTKMDEVEKSVNSMFKETTFKMFEQQINGGEKETCILYYKGVPYSALNFAGKINCGIDIINTMVEHHKQTAPVFIDNVESVTRFIDIDPRLQTIKLIADKSIPEGKIIVNVITQ